MPIDHAARAKKAWPILVRLARKNSGTITYGDLCQKLGLHPRSASWFLGVIQSYCKRRRLPPLQAFAVNKGTGVPGKGYTGSNRSKVAHRRALAGAAAYSWALKAPTFGV